MARVNLRVDQRSRGARTSCHIRFVFLLPINGHGNPVMRARMPVAPEERSTKLPIDNPMAEQVVEEGCRGRKPFA